DRDGLLRRLDAAGYLRVPLVEDPGTMSARGSLLDVWSPGDRQPVRIELDGDLIESIRRFDPQDQKSSDELERLWLIPAREGTLDPDRVENARARLRELCDRVDYPSTKTRLLIDDVVEGRAFFGAEGFLPALADLEPLVDQLPPEALVVIEEPSAAADALAEDRSRTAEDELAKGDSPHYPLDAFYAHEDAVDEWLARHPIVALCETPILGGA